MQCVYTLSHDLTYLPSESCVRFDIILLSIMQATRASAIALNIAMSGPIWKFHRCSHLFVRDWLILYDCCFISEFDWLLNVSSSSTAMCTLRSTVPLRELTCARISTVYTRYLSSTGISSSVNTAMVHSFSYHDSPPRHPAAPVPTGSHLRASHRCF